MKNIRMTMCVTLLMALFAMMPLNSLSQSKQSVIEGVLPDTATVNRQSAIRFGYLSYEAALKSMYEYAEAQDSINAVRTAFEQEMQRVEEEFNQKYESFLEGQREFPRTILLKRQNELQELMQRNLDFKAKARQEISETEERLMKPVRMRLHEVLATVAKEFGLALVINTDSNACPFIDPEMGMDIQSLVSEYLRGEK